MALDLKVIQTAYKGKWKFEDMRGGSKIAILFPNDLVQGTIGFNSEVRFPIMTMPKKQTTWNSSTGFVETEAEEKTVEGKLSEPFTVYNRIAEINVPADPSTWAANKVKMINRGEAADIDNFVLNKIATSTTNKVEFAEITKDNFVRSINQLKKQAKANKFELEEAIIFISPDVATAIVESKVETVNLNLETVSPDITRVLNKYSVVEANIDDYGYQMIALLPTAFSWLLGIETPLTVGKYTEGSYLNQLFVALNHFYGGELVQPEFAIGVTKTGTANTQTVTEKKEVNQSKNGDLEEFKNQILSDFESKYDHLNEGFSDLKKDIKKMLAKAKNYKDVEEVKSEVEEMFQPQPETPEPIVEEAYPLSKPEDQDSESENQE